MSDKLEIALERIAKKFKKRYSSYYRRRGKIAKYFIAKKLGLYYPTVAAWHEKCRPLENRGLGLPSFENLVIIAEAADLDPQYFCEHNSSLDTKPFERNNTPTLESVLKASNNCVRSELAFELLCYTFYFQIREIFTNTELTFDLKKRIATINILEEPFLGFSFEIHEDAPKFKVYYRANPKGKFKKDDNADLLSADYIQYMQKLLKEKKQQYLKNVQST